MAYNALKQLENNIAAIRLALEYADGRQLSADDLPVLQGYSGFGGIKAILYPYGEKQEWEQLNATKEDMRLYPLVMELHTLLKAQLPEATYQEVISSVKNSVLTAFYTPAIVPQTLYTALQDQGLAPARLYEPSSGAGIFIT